MTGPLLGGNRTTIASIIYRTGNEADILRPDGQATENRYGKVSDGDVNYTVEDTETFRRIYQSEVERGSEQLVIGGRLDDEEPRIAARHDTGAQEGDRLQFADGSTYSLESRIGRDTHVEFRTTLVT